MHALGQPAPQAPVELVLTGRVEHPRTLTLAELQAMPAVTVEATFGTGQGPQAGRSTGVPSWAPLQAAVLVDEPGRSTPTALYQY